MKDRRRSIRKETWKNKKGLRGGEYLYGFRKESRLYPTVTFVLYYGEKEWDGAKDIHGLLDLTGLPAGLREKVSNYKIHIIEVRKLKDQCHLVKASAVTLLTEQGI